MKRSLRLVALGILALAGCKNAAADRTAPETAVERYRVPLPARPARGADAAKVTIVEMLDYQCPYSLRAAATLRELEQAYPGELRLHLVHFPLPGHADADLAARAVLAADAQGAMWEMHDRLMAAGGKVARVDLFDVAADLGLDLERFERDLDGKPAGDAIDADLALAEKLAVRGTPTFFINGRPVIGALPLDQLRAVVDQELVTARAALERGISPPALYDELTRNAPTLRSAPEPQAGPPGECGAGPPRDCDCAH